MAETENLRFYLIKITTDEFATIGPTLFLGSDWQMKIELKFDFAEGRVIIVQAKCTFEQQGKPWLVVAASCYFQIVEEDWVRIYSEENKKISLKRPHAAHLASFSVGTVRGITHAKTEKMAINSIIVPPISLPEIIKEDLLVVQTN